MKTNFGEFKVMTIRETATVSCESSDAAINYIRANIPNSSWFDREKEAFVCLLMNTRMRIIGFNLVSLGNLNSVQIHPREVFRPAIVAAANSIILVHNHPSDDTTSSEADIKCTRDLIRAGQVLKIEVNDHIIWSETKHCSLRELGYFYN